MKFADIKTAKELKGYLEKQAFHFNRKSVFHYTNLESLLEIIKSKKLKFSTFEKTNDVIEDEFINDSIRKKFYFCFMRSMQENFGMWAMYGGITDNQEKNLRNTYVKIEFDVKELRKIVKKNNIQASLVAYTDMVKADDDNSYGIISCGDCINKNKITVDKKGILSGYIKDNAWKYEKELRLWSDNEFVSIEEIISSIKIIPSPMVSLKKFKELIKNSNYSAYLKTLELCTVKNNYEGKYRPRKFSE